VIRAVLDTNVLASGIVKYATAEGTPARLLHLWQAKRFDLVVSAHILTELGSTLAEPYFRQRLTPEEIEEAVGPLRDEAILTTLTRQVSGIAAHPEDDLVLATAVSAGVDYLVTGDKPLQRLGTLEGVRIVSPREFLDLLQESSNAEDP
jgi:putative PIN family toxin of toxin-antitoxin system